MGNLADINFIVVDVETTGTSSSQSRITEIACVVVNDGAIRHEFSSLVNPRQFIPAYIEQMTGITNAMVRNAPDELDVFRQVHTLFMLPNTVFVGHNEQFDWGFVTAAMQRCDIDMPPLPRLCTCKLARRLLPKDKKKNLGAVSKHYGIEIESRHRAFGDAQATAKVLLEMIEEIQERHEAETFEDILTFQNQRLKKFLPTPRVLKRVQPTLDSLPEEPGVYYMKDSSDFIMYVGKAKSLKDRVRSYFQLSAQHPKKIAEMVQKVHSIHYEVTDTDLGAMIFESREIKRLKPPYNTMSKKLRSYPFLRLTTNQDFPRMEWCSSIDDDGAEYYGPFPSRSMAEQIRETIEHNFPLRTCAGELQPHAEFRPCFYYHIKKCGAPCAQLQSKEEYAQAVNLTRDFLSGMSTGIVASLEEEMHECAENLDFENAALLRNRIAQLRKLFHRANNAPTAVNHTNIILVLPANERDKTVELFFIKSGMLAHQETIGRKAALTRLNKKIEQVYFNSEQEMPLTREQVSDLKIITGWMYRQKDIGTHIHVLNQTLHEIHEQFANAIRSAHNHTDAISNVEYTQL